MKVHSRNLSLSLLICLLVSPRAFADLPGVLQSNCAVLTRMIGTVEKREPLGSGEKIGLPTPCKLNELLKEGTVVQTGELPVNSMAELRFGAAVTRLWKNSVARIYPGARTVCLSMGALGFQKNRSASDEYLVETKRLQARIRGTTVEVQVGPELDEIQVLECHEPVEVWNKVTNKLVKLSNGVSLQVTGELKNYDPRFDSK